MEEIDIGSILRNDNDVVISQFVVVTVKFVSSQKSREIADYLRGCYLLKKGCNLWSWA
jgi:hypothetical protein